MHSHRERKLRLSLLAADGAIAGLSLLAVGAVWTSGLFREGGDVGPALPWADVCVAALAAATVLPFALDRCGAYRADRRTGMGPMLVSLTKGVVLGGLVLWAVGIAFRAQSLNGLLVGAHAGVCLCALSAQRFAFLSLLRRLQAHDHGRRSFVVIGSDARAREISDRVAGNPAWQMHSLGFLDDEPRRLDVEVLADRYLGKAKEFAELLREKPVDEVIIALPRRQLAEDSTAEVVAVCEAVGVDVTVATDLFTTQRAQVRFHDHLGLPGMTLSSYQRRPLWALAVKRAIDIAGGIAGSVLMLILAVPIGIAIKRESPGPVFYRQRRCGRNGRTFPMLKFRTMVNGADGQQEALREHNEVSGPVFKMKKDPRVTKVGEFLRRTSLDELPQLANVLLGHMSLVGPRPPIPGEVRAYELAQRRRLSVRPGLTCLWQVRGRSLIAFDEWVSLDLEYIDRWSLWLDLWLLVLTIPAVLSMKGAS